ncbi:DUF2127 domain-containing protein [Streptomyces sp. RPT161]|uniref:DUF2127 domain-containing protein n=1 Tax=Streptomyces sp. RPT161 TaxID=3015993 RepID=UPI0022B908D8|nr:DUF2127 domain-containing protein [Streptomyces sp. RPT161]
MDDTSRLAPGADRSKRGWWYELLGCAGHGHELVARDASRIRPQDAWLVREHQGLRWHRCLRCDAWLALPPPSTPGREYAPGREEIQLPLRGRALRDRYVLRLIALDRLLHFLVLAVLAAAVLGFAGERSRLRAPFYRVVDALQNGVGGVGGRSAHGLLGELDRAFGARSATLWAIGAVLAAYAVLEGVEAVGLWTGRRWAEYLTFVATSVLLVPEVYELTGTVTAGKVITLVINCAVVAYLLFAKRLFGVRGGGRAQRAEVARDSGWAAVDRVYPGAGLSGESG